VDFADITVDDSQADTSKAGTFDVKYTYYGVTATATITVKDMPINEGRVIVQYVDENGNKISEDTVLTGNQGEQYQTKAKEIKGYTLSKTPENNEGKFGNKEIFVSYIYKKENEKQIINNNQKDTNDSTNISPKQNQSVFPKTGENTSPWSIYLGAAIILVVSGIYFRKKWNKN
jgi:LPXTG-motif cell wall-anchored protein